MWPRLQRPPGLLLWSHTLFGSVSLHLQLLLLQRNHITEDDGRNDHHLWGKKGSQCDRSAVQRLNFEHWVYKRTISKTLTLCPHQVLNLNRFICTVCYRNQPLGGTEDIIYCTSLIWFHYITGAVCSCYSWFLHAYNPAGELQHIERSEISESSRYVNYFCGEVLQSPGSDSLFVPLMKWPLLAAKCWTLKHLLQFGLELLYQSRLLLFPNSLSA